MHRDYSNEMNSMKIEIQKYTYVLYIEVTWRLLQAYS